MKTSDYRLLEASPGDSICGIGFSAQGAMENKTKWGRNWLGTLLMELRDLYREQEPGEWPEE